ncbi:MAG: TIGR03915 family putative DNA repair protein [Spirochaetaceae bacterium]|nr:TIGR03915 family putative DNA repair protein [Spirochaetaceae bacterium]
MEAEYDGTIFSLFSILDNVFKENNLPDKIIRKDMVSGFSFKSSDTQGELFNTLPDADTAAAATSIKKGYSLKPPSPCSTVCLPSPLQQSYNTAAHKYFEPCRNSFSGQEIIKYSGKAYKDILYAWMSELPIEREIIHFAWKIVSAGRMQEIENNNCDYSPKNKGSSAEKARCDLADTNIKIVMNAASKARKESHFLMGVLRFSIGSNNVAIARCTPDHFILPALAHHFTLRFGNSFWAIIDEKRNISLMHSKSEPAKLTIFDPGHPWFIEESDFNKESFDDWEKMWKNYHTSINIENRNNPNLQRRFIPVRYWKYLPELNDQKVNKP